MCRVSDTGPLMIYPPVLRAGVRKPSGKEPAGGGIGGLLSMGICRGSVLGRGCTGRRNGRRTDDRGRAFVAAPGVGGGFLAWVIFWPGESAMDIVRIYTIYNPQDRANYPQSSQSTCYICL